MTRFTTGCTRRTMLAAGIALAAAPTGALAQNDTASAAQDEGTLTLYTNVDPGIADNLSASFEEAYGITVEVQRSGSSALAQRFTAEAETGNTIADVYYSTDEQFHVDSVASGAFAPLGDMPGLAEWPDEAKGDGYVTIGYNPYSLIWNEDLVPDGMNSWEDLLDPDIAGMVMLTDPRAGVTSNQFYLMLRDLYGDEFLEKLGQVATFSQSAVPGMQQVAAGAQATYAPGINQVAVGLIESGAPLGQAFVEPTISSNNLASVVADAPHPNAARLFVEFLLTDEAQAINNGNGFAPVEGIPNTMEMPEVVEITPDDAMAAQSETIRLLGLSQ